MSRAWKPHLSLLGVIGFGGWLGGWGSVAALGGDGFDPRFRIGDTEPADIESPHPYVGGDGLTLVWSHTVQKDGATFVRVHFGEETDLNEGDWIVVRDAAGRVVREYPGDRAAGRWSPSSPGDRATIELWARPGSVGFGVVVEELGWGTYPLFPKEGDLGGAAGGITPIISLCNTSVPERIRTADPVARLTWADDCGGLFLCTGWLFSPQGHLMTNAHCANSQSEANNLECWFNYVPTQCDLPPPITNPDNYDDAITFIQKDCDRDFAVHLVFDPVKGNPADRYGYLPILTSLPANGTELWIPQHPGGIRKQISEGCHINDNSEPGFNGCADPGNCSNPGFTVGLFDLSFNCGIEGGSSGSPVLNTNNQVVAIAHAGNGFENFGVRMLNIAPLLPDPPIELIISGPATVNEEASAPLSAVADYLIGLNHTVTNFVDWTVNPPTAGSVGPTGLFTANQVVGDTQVTITGEYTEDDVTVEGMLILTVVDLGVDTPIFNVSLTPSVNPANLTPGQTFTVDVRVATDGETVNDIRLIQLDTSLSSGVVVTQLEWGAGNPVLTPGTTLYQFFSAGNVHSAYYPLTSPVPGLIVNFTSAPQLIARVHLVFLADGELNLFGSRTPPTVDESVRFLAGFDEIIEFSQAFANVSGGTLALSAGVGTPAIIASDPPNGAIDARQPSAIDGGSPAGWQTIDLTFSGDVNDLTLDDFTIVEEGGTPPAPSVIAVIPIAPDTVRLVLDTRIEPGARTTFIHDDSGSEVGLGYLPADVTADGLSAPLDILALIDSINGVGAPRPIWSTDINRSGITEPSDILREIDLLNGAGAFIVWNGMTLP